MAQISANIAATTTAAAPGAVVDNPMVQNGRLVRGVIAQPENAPAGTTLMVVRPNTGVYTGAPRAGTFVGTQN